MKPFVYVAGPYTKPDPVQNTRRAVLAGSLLMASGLVVPYVPHLSLFWDAIDPHPYEDWLAFDLDVIHHCQALLRLPGESAGADREEALARRLGLPIFGTVDALLASAGSLSVSDVGPRVGG